jgi:hypothetical protein
MLQNAVNNVTFNTGELKEIYEGFDIASVGNWSNTSAQ